MYAARAICQRSAARLLLDNNGPTKDFADFAENIFRRDSQLAMSGRALEECFGRFLVEYTRVDRSVVQLAKREQGSQRNAPIATLKRRMREQREKKRGDFVRKRRIRFAAEGRDLRALDGVDQSELRLDHAGMCLRAAEFNAHCAMKIDEILDGEIANAAVSR